MRRPTFRAQLVASFVGLVIVAEAIALAVLDRALGRDLIAQLDDRLVRQAEGAASWISIRRVDREGGEPRFDRHAERLANLAGAWVTIVGDDGLVHGDSDLPQPWDPPSDAPEIAAARAGQIGRATRFSKHHAADIYFVAVAAQSGAVVRLGMPLAAIDALRATTRNRLAVAAGLASLIALGLGLLAASLIARPLREMTHAAERIAQGEFQVALDDPTEDELGGLARTLTSLAARLRAFEAMRRDFIAQISHEIRTPVAAIQGYAETLLGGSTDAATRAEFLEVIHRQSLRIGRLVTALLRLAELEARPADELRDEPVRLSAVVTHVFETVRERAAEAKVALVAEVPDGLLARGDADDLEQVVENLVDNAIRYGARPGTVTVRASAKGDRVELVVADDGPGIAAEHLPRLFERFYRVDPARSKKLGGTGLGLAIVERLVTAMRGEVRAESVAGQGSRFVVTLPATRSDSGVT